MRIALAMPSLMPGESRSLWVTKRSSPTSWIFPFDVSDPIDSGSAFQPDQSSSAIPSSSETTGYFSTHMSQYAAISSDECVDWSDFLKTYLPLALSKNSLAAGSRAIATCSPGLYPAALMASRTIWMASSLDLQLGAKPPSSPTAVE